MSAIIQTMAYGLTVDADLKWISLMATSRIQDQHYLCSAAPIYRDHSFPRQIFFKFRGPVCQFPRLIAANAPHIVSNVLLPPEVFGPVWVK